MMKKIVLVMVLFFSFCFVAFASEATISFSEDLKNTSTIKAKKNEIIKVPIYYNTKDYKLYAMLGTLEYDKEHLELVDYTEENGFTITKGERLLADRFGGEMADKGKIVTLNFKVKKTAKSILKLKQISIADLKEERELPDIEITINSLTRTGNVIMIVALGASIIAFGVIKIKKKRS